jgi:hypothetical protein
MCEENLTYENCVVRQLVASNGIRILHEIYIYIETFIHPYWVGGVFGMADDEYLQTYTYFV